MKTEQHYKQEFDMGQFVKGLKKEDTRYLALTNTFKWIMFVLAPFYFLIFVLSMIIDHPEIDKFGFLFFSLGFLAFALLFKSLYQEYKSVDYGVSTIEMLRNAANRYELWQAKTYLTIIPTLLCAIGFSFSAQKGFPFDDLTIRILVGFGSILFILCCSGFVGYLIWRRRQKPLRDKALELIKEMGE